MDEVENNSVIQEVASPETDHIESQSEVMQPVEDRQDRNWRELRRAKEDLEKKARMQEELIGQLLSAQKSYTAVADVDELDSIPADDYIPKGQVEKLVSKKAEKIAQEAVKKALQEREKMQYMERLQSKFADFNDVVTPENLEILEQQDPELAKTIADTSDPYTIGLQSYKFIKSMGIASKAQSYKRNKEVDEKLEKNAKTVQTPQAFDKRPMAQTFELTKAMKNELYKEMMTFASNSGGSY